MIKRLHIPTILIGLGALSVLAVALACGGGAQEDAVTKEELRSVVQEAVAASAPTPAPVPAGPTAEEMRQMVAEAMADAAPPALGMEEIGAMVEAAVAALSADAVSGEEIEQLVAKAVEDAVSQGPTPLSAAEIEAIVGAAIAAIPVPETIVTVVTPTAVPGAAPPTAMAPKELPGIQLGIRDDCCGHCRQWPGRGSEQFRSARSDAGELRYRRVLLHPGSS